VSGARRAAREGIVRGDARRSAARPQPTAMKLLAMRFREDGDDIRVLLAQTGIATADEALALMVRNYPNREPPLKTRLFLAGIMPMPAP
jgi:hypothetical protein